jgi:Homeodomain-like domain-containing protein
VLSKGGIPMAVSYVVELSEEERGTLRRLIAGGKRSARIVKRAQILLAADARQSDETIAGAVGVGTSTVYRTKRRFVEGSVEHALHEQPHLERGASSRGTKRRC